MKRKNIKLRNIYLVGNTRYVKVGVSSVPEQRMVDLQTALPFEIDLLLKLPLKQSQWAFLIEDEVRAYFKASRCRGEWFDFAPLTR